MEDGSIADSAPVGAEDPPLTAVASELTRPSHPVLQKLASFALAGSGVTIPALLIRAQA